MRKTSAKFLAEAAKARLLGNENAEIAGVKIDSRAAGEGDLFVCVVGEVNDGHRFWEGAAAKGCRAFLMSEEDVALAVTRQYPDACVILAEDTSIALRDMAAAYLGQFSPKRIGVTGSVGKTSTRTYCDAVLSAKYKTQSSRKNLNTHLGLCLTCFLADETTEMMVFEMGMDRSGEIAEYVDWIFPETAVITNVGITHLEKLGSRDAIADAKLEIVKNFGPENLLIYNGDSDYLNPKEIKDRAPGDYQLFGVGTSEEARLRLGNIASNGDGVRFTLEYEGESQDFFMPVLGRHNAIDGALAAAVGLRYGVTLQEAADALRGVKPNPRRMDAVKLSGIYIIDDTYNASPASMIAALDVLDEIKAVRKIAVLADMLELGEMEEEGHLQVGQRIAASDADILFAVGPRAKTYAECAGKNKNIKVHASEKLEDLEGLVFETLRTGDAVLIKGSNITGVAGLAQRLRENLSWER